MRPGRPALEQYPIRWNHLVIRQIEGCSSVPMPKFAASGGAFQIAPRAFVFSGLLVRFIRSWWLRTSRAGH